MSAFFSTDHGLPVILLIRRVLLRAFELLREQNYNLAAAIEDQVTAALRSTIESSLRQSGEVSGFNKRKYETVIRQGQWANHDGTRLTKTPDLFFKLRDDGLIRFVGGDYAWAMQEAMMLAYARDGRTIAGHMIPEMTETNRMTSLATVQLPEACLATAAAACSEAEAVHTTQHRRNFPWPHGKGPATDITVYHLWHRCSA